MRYFTFHARQDDSICTMCYDTFQIVKFTSPGERGAARITETDEGILRSAGLARCNMSCNTSE